MSQCLKEVHAEKERMEIELKASRQEFQLQKEVSINPHGSIFSFLLKILCETEGMIRNKRVTPHLDSSAYNARFFV